MLTFQFQNLLAVIHYADVLCVYQISLLFTETSSDLITTGLVSADLDTLHGRAISLLFSIACSVYSIGTGSVKSSITHTRFFVHISNSRVFCVPY